MHVSSYIHTDQIALMLSPETNGARFHSIICTVAPPILTVKIGSFEWGDPATLAAAIKELQEVQGIALDLQSRLGSFYNEKTGKSCWTPEEERGCRTP